MRMNADALLQGPRGRHLSLAVAHRLHQRVWAAWLEAARHTQDPERHAALVRTIRETDPSRVTAWLDPLAFLAPMDEAVSSGMGWQPPHDEDVVAATADVIEALQAIAEAIMAAPATRWWQDAIDLDALRYTARYDAQFPAGPPRLVGAADMLDAWKDEQTDEDRRARAERANDPGRNYSGTWWSTPAGVGLLTTTRPCPVSARSSSSGRRTASGSTTR